MRIATTLFATCALLLSLPTPAGLTVNCKSGKDICDVTVIVPAGCGSGIHVAPDPIVLEDGDVTITWTIRSSPDWYFARTDAIKIHKGEAFTPTSKGESKSFTVERRARKPGIFKYDINLARMEVKKGKDGKEVRKVVETCKHDPTIVDQ